MKTVALTVALLTWRVAASEGSSLLQTTPPSLLQVLPNQSLYQVSLLTAADQANLATLARMSAEAIPEGAEEAIIKLCQERAVDNTVILVYANVFVKAVLVNWLVQMRHLDHFDGVVIASLDEEIHEFLTKRSLPSVLVATKRVRGGSDLWMFRAQLTARILQETKVNVLMSDADAMVMKPVLPYLKNIEGDVVASRAVFPHRYEKIWGATACMGFILFRASLSNESIQLWKSLSLEEADDQIGFNMMLNRSGVLWDNEMTVWDSVSVDRGKFGAQSISLLPHNLFERHCTQKPTAYVKHCRLMGHIDQFKKYDQWFLPDGWESRSFYEPDTWLTSLFSH